MNRVSINPEFVNSVEVFRAEMRRAGLDYAGPIMGDGKIHRFKTTGDHNKNSWFIHFPSSPMAGVFGCWKRGFKQNWCARSANLTQADWDAIRQRWQQAEKEIGARQKKARETAEWIWNRAKPLTYHAYLTRKHVGAYGEAREYRGAVVLTLRDTAGQLHSLQFIGADGKKRFLSGGRVQECFFSLDAKANGPLAVTEGYATGATVHEATGFATICAMNCGNLMEVARAVRGTYPSREIIICADSDQWTPDNPGLSKGRAAARAIGAKLAVPQFKDTTTKPTDFNDLNQLEGYSAVKNQIENTTEPEQHTPPDLKAEWLADFDKSMCASSKLAQLTVPAREAVLGEWFKEGDLGFIFSPRGLGKTWLALHIGRQCSEGGEVGPWKVHKKRRVLYVDGEMPLDGIRERDVALSTGPAEGIEASADISQSAENKWVTCGCETAYTQIRAQIEKPVDSDLEKVISAWPELSAPIKAAILALIGAAAKEVAR